MAPISVKNSHDTGDETLVSMTTKMIELLIFQKMTKHVLDDTLAVIGLNLLILIYLMSLEYTLKKEYYKYSPGMRT